MGTYKVTAFQATRWQITKNGVPAADLHFWHDQKEEAQKIADALNAAFEAGKVAQKLESTPLLAALCA